MTFTSNKNARRMGFVFALLASVLLVAGSVGDAKAAEKSVVYALGNNNGFLQFPVLAYLVNGDELILADTAWLDMGDMGGPVGLMADPVNKKIYIAHHHNNTLATVHTETLEPLGLSLFNEAQDLAGMDIDLERGLLYVANRETTDMFVYNSADLSLVNTLALGNCQGAFGVSVNDGVLFVGDASNTLRYYDAENGSELGGLTTTEASVATALKGSEFAYTTMGQFSNTLTQIELTDNTERMMDLGAIAKGLTVNDDRNLAYVLTGFGDLNNTGIRVIDGDAMAELAFYPFGDGTWSPTDVVASSGDFGNSIKVKASSDEAYAPGDTVSYEVAFTNNFDSAIHVMPAEIIFDNTVLELVSSDPAMDNGNGWTNLIGDADLALDASFSINLTFKALDNETDGYIIVKTENAMDEDGNALTGVAGRDSFEVKSADADDDDDDEPTPNADEDSDSDEGGCGC